MGAELFIGLAGLILSIIILLVGGWLYYHKSASSGTYSAIWRPIKGFGGAATVGLFSQSGNVVTVTVYVKFVASSQGVNVATLSLPVARTSGDFIGTAEAGGTGYGTDGASSTFCTVYANPKDQTVTVTGISNANISNKQNLWVTFNYTI